MQTTAVNKKHNFSAGPAILPDSVMEQAAEAVRELDGCGLSLIEMSHRGKEFVAIMEEAQQLVKDIYGLGDDYDVMYLQGGASMQFCMVPFNLMPEGGTAAYMDTGAWASKALKEAKLFGNVHTAGSSKEANYNFIPKNISLPADCSYFHFTTNNTIYGTEITDLNRFETNPKSLGIPVVADMSSDIFGGQVNVRDFDLVYAGAQKNMGPSGTTMVMVRKGLLKETGRMIPTMLNYNTHIAQGSMFNTPPVFPIYVCMLTLRWVKEMGGLAAMEQRNAEKARLLYDAIDDSSIFSGTAAVEDRSRMNVPFVLDDPSRDADFLKFAADAGLVGLKGHRSVGGFRASIYNAMPLESVQALVDAMSEFERMG